MKKIYLFYTAFLLCAAYLLGQSPLIVTYTDGDIPTRIQSPWVGPSTCPGVMTVTIPEGHWITSIDVAYSMTAESGAWMSEQRSRLYSPTTNMGEPQYYSGIEIDEGTMDYERNGLWFANFASGEIIIELHAGRTWGGTGCSTEYNKVDNNTWTLTIHYGPIVPCLEPYGLTLAGATNTTANVDWLQFGDADSWDIIFGEPGFDPQTGGTLVTGIIAKPYTLEGLTPDTSYDLYIRANCGADGLSEWSALLAFQTLENPLAGNYTINKNLPTGGNNFNSFSDLAEVVNVVGVSGHVVVDVVEGTGPYFEQVIFGSLPGSSHDNTLTINGNGEVLQFRSFSSTRRATLRFNGTSYVTVNQLVIEALGQSLPWPAPAEYGYAVKLVGAANHNTFYQCHFITNTVDNNLIFIPFIAILNTTTNEAASHLTIQGCQVVGGQYGISIIGRTSEPFATGNAIVGNEIRDFNMRGISVTNQHQAVISQNHLSRPTRIDVSDVNMIYLELYMAGSLVSKNYLFGFSSQSAGNANGIYSSSMRSNETEPVTISNNHISGFENIRGNHSGIMLFTFNHQGFVNVYHNTVLLDYSNFIGNSVVRCFYHSGDNAVLDLQNNIFSYTTNSSGIKANMHFTRTSVTLNSQNNVLHRGSQNQTDQYTAIWGAATYFEELEFWQSFHGDAYDQQSSDADPLVVNGVQGTPLPSNPAISQLGIDLMAIVPDDIDGMPRTPTPDPGAHQFEPADCLRPSNLLASNITQEQAELGWAQNGTETIWNLQYGPLGFELGTGTTVEQLTNNPFLLEGLQPVDGYDFFVQAVCEGKTTSAWAGPHSFFTLCNAFETPIIENFDHFPSVIGMPLCWEAVVTNAFAAKVIVERSISAHSQPFHVELYNGNELNGDILLVTPEIAGGLQGSQVRFMARSGFSTLSIQVGTYSNEGTFTLLETFGLNTIYTEFSLNLDDYTGTDNRIAFRHGLGDTYRNIFLDDVFIIKAQDYASISGKVYNNSGVPVSGARVSGDGFSTVTSETGTYSFEGIVPGTYTIVAEAGGFAVERAEVTVGKGEGLEKDISFTYENFRLPADPEEVGLITFPAGAWNYFGSATDGRYAYIPMNNNNLYVYDLINPSSPALTSSNAIASVGKAFFNENLFVRSGNMLKIYDVSNPSSLNLVGDFDIGGEALDMFFSNSIAYVLVWLGATNSKLVVLDVSDPSNLIELASIDVVSGRLGSMSYSPSRRLIFVHGLRADQIATVSIIDFNNASSPSIEWSGLLGMPNSSMAASKDFIFLAYNDGSTGTIEAYSTENPESPVLLKTQALEPIATVFEISNIANTLLLHIQVQDGKNRKVSYVYDADLNQFFEGMGMETNPWGIPQRYAYVLDGFGGKVENGATDGFKGGNNVDFDITASRDGSSQPNIDFYILPKGTSNTLSDSYGYPIRKIKRPPPEEDEVEDCEAELTVSGIKGPVYYCPSEIEENPIKNMGTVQICACEESDWTMSSFNIEASGTGNDAADISHIRVEGPGIAFGKYQADDGVFNAVFEPPVTIPKGECVAFVIFYTFSFDHLTYAYDENKTFKWQTKTVTAEPIDCPKGEIEGLARNDSLTFARVFRFRDGVLQDVYPKIEHAIYDPKTMDGDLISICEGIYATNVTIDKGLTIKGFSGKKEKTIVIPLINHLPVFKVQGVNTSLIFKEFTIKTENK